jgi:hypothetical protein
LGAGTGLELTVITTGTDQRGCLAGCPQAKPAYFGKNISGARGAILLNGRFYNGE